MGEPDTFLWLAETCVHQVEKILLANVRPGDAAAELAFSTSNLIDMCPGLPDRCRERERLRRGVDKSIAACASATVTDLPRHSDTCSTRLTEYLHFVSAHTADDTDKQARDAVLALQLSSDVPSLDELDAGVSEDSELSCELARTRTELRAAMQAHDTARIFRLTVVELRLVCQTRQTCEHHDNAARLTNGAAARLYRQGFLKVPKAGKFADKQERCKARALRRRYAFAGCDAIARGLLVNANLSALPLGSDIAEYVLTDSQYFQLEEQWRALMHHTNGNVSLQFEEKGNPAFVNIVDVLDTNASEQDGFADVLFERNWTDTLLRGDDADDEEALTHRAARAAVCGVREYMNKQLGRELAPDCAPSEHMSHLARKLSMALLSVSSVARLVFACARGNRLVSLSNAGYARTDFRWSVLQQRMVHVTQSVAVVLELASCEHMLVALARDIPFLHRGNVARAKSAYLVVARAAIAVFAAYNERKRGTRATMVRMRKQVTSTLDCLYAHENESERYAQLKQAFRGSRSAVDCLVRVVDQSSMLLAIAKLMSVDPQRAGTAFDPALFCDTLDVPLLVSQNLAFRTALPLFLYNHSMLNNRPVQ